VQGDVGGVSSPEDEPLPLDVLSKVAGILGDNNISISSVIQKGRHEQSAVPIVMMTHEAVEGDMQRSLKAIDHLDLVSRETVCLRVEGASA